MGGASVAVANDITAGYWNPAGLAHMNYPQISLMHEEHFGSLVNYNYAAIAIPYGKDMVWTKRNSFKYRWNIRRKKPELIKLTENIDFNDPNWQLLHPN